METKIKIEEILKSVIEFYKVNRSDIISNSRRKDFCKPRFIFCALLRRAGLNYHQIADFLKKDHTTVIHACNAAESRWAQEMNALNLPLLDIVDISEYKNPYSRGRSKKWKWVYEFFGGKCAVCGFSDVTNVHHIIPRSIGGTDDPGNILLLCPNHHALLHLGLVNINELSIPRKVIKKGYQQNPQA